MRKDQIAAAQIVLNTQVKVDENNLRAQAIKKDPVDHLARLMAVRDEAPWLYKLRDAREREHVAALQGKETPPGNLTRLKGEMPDGFTYI